MAARRAPGGIRRGGGGDGGAGRGDPRRARARARVAAGASAALYARDERAAGRAARLRRASGFPDRSRRAVYLSRAGAANRLCHARSARAGAAGGRAAFRARPRRVDYRRARRSGRARVSARGRAGRMDRNGRRRRENRRARRAPAALGELSRGFRECRARPCALCGNRALRRARRRRDVAGGARPRGGDAERDAALRARFAGRFGG